MNSDTELLAGHGIALEHSAMGIRIHTVEEQQLQNNSYCGYFAANFTDNKRQTIRIADGSLLQNIDVQIHGQLT